MTIAEGSGISLRYKFYSGGTMVANTEADLSTDPGTSNGQVLRFTQLNINLATNTTVSQEIIPSRQIRSARRTSRNVTGSIMGELSPGTYFDFFEAALRGTRGTGGGGTGATFTGHYGVSAVTVAAGGASYTDGDVLTLAGSGSSTITATVSGGVVSSAVVTTAGSGVTSLPSNPRAVTGGTGTGATFNVTWKLLSVTTSGGSGYSIGDTLVFTGFTASVTPTAHISAVSGGVPSTIVVDTAGSGISVVGTLGDIGAGSAVLIPSSGHVRRKLMIERYNTDLDLSRLYTECRVTGFKLSVPAQGNSTIEWDFMGRNRVTKSSTDAPYLTAPADATSTDVCNSLSGSLTIGGTPVGLVTAANINLTMNSEAPNVLGQPFPPDILLGIANVSGTLTFLLDEVDNASTIFENETEVAVVLKLTNSASGGDSITFSMPRVKLTSGDEQVRGDLSQPISCNFQALEASTGGILSTIQIQDSAVA